MAFHTLLQYLKQVGVIEMVPMQIRMMVLDGGMSQHQLGGARRLVERIFELQPSAYWALVVIQEENDANPRNYDDGSSGHGENVVPLDKVVQLRNAPLPGQTLENVLLRALGLEDIELTLEGSHISSGDGNVDRMAASVSIRIAFLSAALQHDDYMRVYCLARALLSTIARMVVLPVAPRVRGTSLAVATWACRLWRACWGLGEPNSRNIRPKLR